MVTGTDGAARVAGVAHRVSLPADRGRFQTNGLRELCLLLAAVYMTIIVISLLAGGARIDLELGAALGTAFALVSPLLAARKESPEPSRAVVVILSVGLGLALIGAGLRGNNGFAMLGLATLLGIVMAVRGQARLGLIIALMSPFAVEAVAGSPGSKAALIAVLLLVATSVLASACITAGVLLRVAVGGSALYIGAATALYLAGVRSSYVESYTGKFATYGGFFAERWRFPLSNTWVTVPIVATFTLVGVCALAGLSHRTRDTRTFSVEAKVVYTVIACVAFFAIVAANGRTALLIAIVGCLLSQLRPTRLVRLIAAGAQVLWLAPFVWQWLVINNPAVGALVQAVVPNRQHTSFSSATLEGRSTIWQLSVQSISHGSSLDRILGFGPDGYIASGASLQYLSVLAPGYTAGYYPPHNAVLEILLNAGFVVLAVMACIYFTMVVRPALKPALIPAELRRPHVALLVVTPGLAFTEVAFVPSNGTPAVTVLYLTLGFAVLAQNTRLGPSRDDRLVGVRADYPHDEPTRLEQQRDPGTRRARYSSAGDLRDSHDGSGGMRLPSDSG